MRRQLAERLRRTFSRPKYPPKTGTGIIPWLASRDIQTRLLFNPLRDPLLRDGKLGLHLTRFSCDGVVLDERPLALPANGILAVDLPWEDKLGARNETLRYGYCWVRDLGERRSTIPLQTHFQIMGQGTFAKTHGRAKGAVLFQPMIWVDRLVGWLDPYPYTASSVLVSGVPVCQGYLIFNVSNRPCQIRYAYDAVEAGQIRVPPHGTHLMMSDRSDAQTVEFRGSSPFTYYSIIMRQDGKGITMQHILDSF